MKPELWQAVSKRPDSSTTTSLLLAQSLPIPPAASISGLLPIISCCPAMLYYSLPTRDNCRNAATFPLGSVCAGEAEVPVSVQAACWGEELAANHSTPIWCQQPARCHRLLPSSLIRGADPVRLETGMWGWEVSSCFRHPACMALEMCSPSPTPTLTLSHASCLICPTTSCMQIIILECLRQILLLNRKISIRLLCLAWLPVAPAFLWFILLYLAGRGWKNIVVLDPACLTYSFLNI